MRPGMYIGKLGDGSSPDDGIYILLKEVLDNSVDEFVMGAGKTIEISISENGVSVRDYGRGIPLGKVVDVVSKMNTGGKYDTRAFKKSVGLNGVGTKAVNALSSIFKVESCREGKLKSVVFQQGNLIEDLPLEESSRRKGTKVSFIPDNSIFKYFKYRAEYVSKMLKYYVYLNPGLTIVFNGDKYFSDNGLKDLLEDNNDVEKLLYPIIYLKGNDIEVALTHSRIQYSEEYYSFVNGQHTTQGGTHQSAFRESLVKTIRDFYGKQYDAHRAVAMLILYTFIVIFIVALFRNRGLLSANIANILVAIVLLVGAVIIYFRVSDLSMRNNMDYDKYEWPSMPSDGKKLKDYVPPPPDPVGGESNCPKDPSSCVGEKCCGTGTTYDDDSKKCKTIVTTDVSTRESFVSMFREGRSDGVSPYSEPHNCASI